MRISSLAILLLVLIGGSVSTAQAQVTPNSVQVSWTTPGDDGNSGQASQFDLRYSTSIITANNFSNATRFTQAPAPGASGTHQSATVTGLLPNTTYYFAIKTGDEVPNWAGISNVISRTTLPAADVNRPAPVTTLSIPTVTETTASVRWVAVGDDSLTGTATSYDIRYSTSPITAANFGSATQTTGEPAPALAGTTQNFTVTGLSRQTTYYFAMKVSDEAGNISALSNVPNATTTDQTPPAVINDLAVGLVWYGWAPTVHPAQVLSRTRR